MCIIQVISRAVECDDKNEFHFKPSGTTDKSHVITVTHSRLHSHTQHTLKRNNEKATPQNV